jgi:hypothetical protein
VVVVILVSFAYSVTGDRSQALMVQEIRMSHARSEAAAEARHRHDEARQAAERTRAEERAKADRIHAEEKAEQRRVENRKLKLEEMEFQARMAREDREFQLRMEALRLETSKAQQTGLMPFGNYFPQQPQQQIAGPAPQQYAMAAYTPPEPGMTFGQTVYYFLGTVFFMWLIFRCNRMRYKEDPIEEEYVDPKPEYVPQYQGEWVQRRGPVYLNNH